MQYVTTRNNDTLYTCLEALNGERAPDGGFFIPQTMPRFTQEEIQSLALKNPNQAAAEMINLLFDTQLNRWDVDFAVGRHPVRLHAMVRRITIAEFWHNLDWDFPRTIRDLAAKIRGSWDTSVPAGDWGEIGIRVAFLFGLFGELMRDGLAGPGKPMDVAVPSADLRSAMAAWYARSWGLPIGSIIICCNENNELWNLIRQGEMRTDLPVTDTCTPDCDHPYPPSLERLIYGCGGREEVLRFISAAENGRAFFTEASTLEALQDRIYVSVVGQNRVGNTISAIYQNNGYVMGPYCALCHAGLSDFRAGTGSSGHALILSDRGALCDDGFVAREIGIAVSTLHKKL